jgi:hypothetical protein
LFKSFFIQFVKFGEFQPSREVGFLRVQAAGLMCGYC